jgi:hypothetical protein
MYDFDYYTNVVNDNVMYLPYDLGRLCWFVHPYEVETATTLFKGYDSWCGYYMGTILTDTENMKFQHCVETSPDNKIYFVDALFSKKEEAEIYIKENLTEERYVYERVAKKVK